MTPLHRIALITQWTEFDAGAERVALELAQRLKRPLAVIVPLLTNPELEVVAQQLVADAEAATARSVAEFQARARAAGVTTEIRVRRGDQLWREVVDETRVAAADLLVTRRRGQRGFFGRLQIGEMVQQIAVNAPCPVLIVPRQAPTPTQRVLVAVEATADAEPHSSPRPEPIATAAVVASQLGLALEVVPMSTPDAITAALRERPADLLVLGIDASNARHGRLGDTVEAIVGAAPCATLLVRAHAHSS